MDNLKISEKFTNEDIVKEMLGVGFQYGYSKGRRNPSVESYILTFKDKMAVINLEKSAQALKKAIDFLVDVTSQGGVVLWVGNKPEAKLAIKKTALALNMPFVAERWIGGTLTNFSEIRKRVNRLLEIKEEEQKGGLAKYTKKERLVIDKEKKDLERYFSGIVNMDKKPKVLVLIDPKDENTALREAKRLNLSVVALANTDCDIKDIDYPVVGNDYNSKSIDLFLKFLSEAVKEGKKRFELSSKELNEDKEKLEVKNL